MRFWLTFLAGSLLFFGTMYAFQKPFKEFSGTEYRMGTIPLPPDWNEKADFVFARLMFPGGPLDGYQRTGRFTGDYHYGLSLWTQDYPRADRHFLEAVRRLTSVQADLFGFEDRGRLVPGAWADVVVFDPETVAPGPLRRLADFPAGSERLTADQPTGIRHVLVNGTPIQVDGEHDAAARPGQLVKPAAR